MLAYFLTKRMRSAQLPDMEKYRVMLPLMRLSSKFINTLLNDSDSLA